MKKIKFLFIASALLLAFGCNKEDNPSGGSDGVNSNEGLTKPVEEFTVKGISFKMIRVDSGTFTMGATPEQGNDPRDNEKPAHQVTLSDYYIGQLEVTQELWQAVMGSNPSKYQGPKNPVEQVSWNDIVNDFLPKLNKLTGRNFTLPTEAQWEFAARGGNKSRGYKYSGGNDIYYVAWYDGNGNEQSHPVGQKSPNELGLCDMSGNVYEWCSDFQGFYTEEAQTDPLGPAAGVKHVCRGGFYFSYESSCRVSYRYFGNPDYAPETFGFRLALSCPSSFEQEIL